MSRNILEITISKEACPSPGADGKPLLDISVATPNGVSNHLLMKMRPPRPDHKESDKDPSEATEQKPPPKGHGGSAKTARPLTTSARIRTRPSSDQEDKPRRHVDRLECPTPRPSPQMPPSTV
ncbi:MAG: hypothetical protein ACXVBG_02420 [Isosphaeraceae bacterium]